MKQASLVSGLDSMRFSGHSLRLGLLTPPAIYSCQLPLVGLMRQSRHNSDDIVQSYIGPWDAWRNNITDPFLIRRRAPLR
jgi:hypothetical protein